MRDLDLDKIKADAANVPQHDRGMVVAGHLADWIKPVWDALFHVNARCTVTGGDSEDFARVESALHLLDRASHLLVGAESLLREVAQTNCVDIEIADE